MLELHFSFYDDHASLVQQHTPLFFTTPIHLYYTIPSARRAHTILHIVQHKRAVYAH